MKEILVKGAFYKIVVTHAYSFIFDPPPPPVVATDNYYFSVPVVWNVNFFKHP